MSSPSLLFATARPPPILMLVLMYLSINDTSRRYILKNNYALSIKLSIVVAVGMSKDRGSRETIQQTKRKTKLNKLNVKLYTRQRV